MKHALPFLLLLATCVGCSTSSPAYTTVPDAGAGGLDPVYDAGPSFITPGEVPDEHYPDGFACGAAIVDDGGIDRCGDPVAIGCCHSDADCVHGTAGHCSVEDAGRIGLCTYADHCESSADCATGTTCVCGKSNAPGNRCSRSICRFDSDCGAGQFCSPSRTSCFNNLNVFTPDGVYCHTPQDRCFNDRDCSKGKICGFVPEHALWTCIEPSCAAG